MADETGMIVSYLTIIVIVGVFSYFVSAAVPGSPQIVGWDSLTTQLTQNPILLIPSAFNFNQHACSGWDVGCWLSNIAYFMVGVAWGFISIIWWVIVTVASLALVLFGVATLTFYPPIPLVFQAFLWIITIPLWLLLVITFLRLIRGGG